MKICLYGAARQQIDSSYMEEAQRFGRSLAARGHSMVFGGGARGMMGAAARGVREGGGSIVAVAPGDRNFDEEDFNDCDHYIRTESLAERKTLFIELSDSFVVMPGGIGTYDELFDLISVKRLNEWTTGASAGQTGLVEKLGLSEEPLFKAPLSHISQRPVAIYNINGYYDPLKKLLDETIRKEFAAKWTADLYTFCDTEEEVWRCLEGFPEECCDAAEMSDSDYENWERRSRQGFWKAFLQDRNASEQDGGGQPPAGECGLKTQIDRSEQ